VYSPADPIEVQEVLTLIRSNDSPAYLRLGKNGEPKIEKTTSNFVSGSVRELRSGSDLSILATGAISENCLKVAEQLATEKYQVQVISIPKIQPLDINYISSLISAKKVLIVEEHVERGGFASAILEAFNKIDKQVKLSHLYVLEKNISEIGTQEYLRGLSNLDQKGIRSRCLELLKDN
jgi:transketolase